MALDTERSRVAHLLRRASFGSTEAELEDYVGLGFSAALDRLVNYEQVDDSALEQRLATLQIDVGNVEGARLWWLNRMLYTRRPLQEKMALFWHNHFATAASKVRLAPLMLQQIQLFREGGMGNFETLLRRVTRDPAMLQWLDNRENRKGAPNENYAREVMELFTVGIGNYSEDDIKEAARAFTGYTSRQNQYVFIPEEHDNGLKAFMGETRAWDADDILAKLVRHPATARYLGAKLFRFFVHDQPTPETVERLAGIFTSTGFDIRAVVRDILSGPEFLASDAYHGQVKQPIELVLGALKALDAQNVAPDLPQVIRRMGQDLLNPPDVSGWRGGATWLNSSTLLERFNFADRLAGVNSPDAAYFTDIASQMRAHDLRTAADVVNFYVNLLVDGDTSTEARRALVDYLAVDVSPEDGRLPDDKVRSTVHLVMSLPTYQLS
ncbi:MAG TPA: DUF1800 domain-containing protein [Chloroflexota bacterium]